MSDINVESWLTSSSPLMSLKGIFLGHFIFISLIFDVLVPQTFLFYNLTYIFLLVWSHINKSNYEIVHLALLVNILSIPLDIIVISLYLSIYQGSVIPLISGICNLLFRVFSGFVLKKELNNRSDADGLTTGSPFGGQYQDIDGGIP